MNEVKRNDILVLGRSPECDVTLSSPLISRKHAALINKNGVFFLKDLGSTNGTYVEGRRIDEYRLQAGDVIYLGPCRLEFDGQKLLPLDSRGSITIEADHLCSHPPGAPSPILQDINLYITPGELVAIVGASGAGKSTLMKCLSGQLNPTNGSVKYNGLDAHSSLDLFRPLIGFVPQDDIVHCTLPVDAALSYCAKLRLPPDTTQEEIKRRIDFVLATLNLTHRQHNRILNLSGGERKRVSIAVELLTEPSLFFLDEPTSGLDPGMEKKAMQLLSFLAKQGRTVIVITHATASINLCDKVIFLAPGGRLTFYGPPSEALKFFAVTDFADIYLKTDTKDKGIQWSQRFATGNQNHYPPHNVRTPTQSDQQPHRPQLPTDSSSKHKGHSAWRQFCVLSQRYAHIIASDRPNLLLLTLQAPIIGTILSLLFKPNLFALKQELGRNGKFPIHEGPTLIFMLLVTCIFFGAINSCREVVKEYPIYTRERLVKLLLLPYLLSKVAVLLVVGVFQCLLVLMIVAYKIELYLDLEAYLKFYALLLGAYTGGVSLGLFLSCFCTSAEQATSLVSVLLIIQLVFSGAFIKPEEMHPILRSLSIFAISRWSFAGLGSIMHFNERFEELGAGWITSDFYLSPAQTWSILGPLLLLHLTLAAISLRWRETHDG